MTLNESSLEKRFQAVSTSAGSIQSLSFFCLHYKDHHKKIAHIWLRCLQKAKVAHRLTLIYLANDIVQNAKRKNTLSFIDAFRSVLKEAVSHLRDEKIKKSVERVFSIWQDRNIFDSKFTIELKNYLNDTGRGHRLEPTKSSVSNGNDANRSSTTTNDLMDSLNKLSNIEKSMEKLKLAEDNIVDRLAQGTFSSGDNSDAKSLNDLRNFIVHLKTEIEERNRLTKLLEESMNNQRKLLKESEDQLVMYKKQLEFISKLREDLSSSP